MPYHVPVPVPDTGTVPAPGHHSDGVVILFHSTTEYPNNGMKFVFYSTPLHYIPLCFIPLCSVLYHQSKHSFNFCFLLKVNAFIRGRNRKIT
ncbi:hypothetical protein QL285_012702 [Trifolium repens]|nr:hypothetical protein QL285_012702 [Trifolium repens]